MSNAYLNNETYMKYVREWLKDAHAMEKQGEELFTGQAKRLDQYQELSAKVTAEIDFFAEHQKLLDLRMDELGSGSSFLKNIASKLVATGQNASGIFVSDEPVKAILSLHTYTQMASGSYKILLAAADAHEDEGTAEVCHVILRHTEARALWINTELDSISKLFLIRNAVTS